MPLRTQETEPARISTLVAQNAAPRQQLDQLEASVEAAKVQISAAENAVAMASKAIGDATVRAPIDGVVLEKRLSVGEYATMMPPTPVLVLQDQATLELKFRLPERILASIRKGDKVTVAIPALEVARDAVISEVAPMVDTRTRTIELTAVLDNADGALRPGLMAEVKLQGPS
jgi:membrane fusion protein (multidrug efflux system)